MDQRGSNRHPVLPKLALCRFVHKNHLIYTFQIDDIAGSRPRSRTFLAQSPLKDPVSPNSLALRVHRPKRVAFTRIHVTALSF